MDAESLARRRTVASLAAKQHGVIARRQLVETGLGRGAISRWIESGRLHPLHAGVYLLGHAARPPYALEMAAALACGPDAVVSHRSAGKLWRLVQGPDAEYVEVTVVRPWRPSQPNLRVYSTSSLYPLDVRPFARIPTTSPARTLLDLGRFLSASRLEPIVADALRRGLVRRLDLIDQLERNRGRRGVAALRAIVNADHEPALTRSKAESRMRSLIRRAGLPPPELNARLGGYEVDFLWRRERLVVEVDGFAFHGDRLAFESDRARDAHLQAEGFRVIRVTWRQLVAEPEVVIGRIRSALARARASAPL